MKNINNNINNYNNLLYNSRPVKFNEFINNQYNKIHNELYLDALNKFLSDEKILKSEQFVIYNGDLDSIMNNTKIIEIKNSEYWQPSSILVISKKYPFYQKKYDLSEYWNNFQDKSNIKISDIRMTKDDIKDPEIVFLNYVSGKAKIESRLNNITFDVDFNYIDENTMIGDDYSLSNTFTNKYYDKIK